LDKRVVKETRPGVVEQLRAKIDSFNFVLTLIGEVQEMVHDIPQPATDPDQINQI